MKSHVPKGAAGICELDLARLRKRAKETGPLENTAPIRAAARATRISMKDEADRASERFSTRIAFAVTSFAFYP